MPSFIPWIWDSVLGRLRKAVAGETIHPDNLADATTSVRGAMSPADKTALDGIPATVSAVADDLDAHEAAAAPHSGHATTAEVSTAQAAADAAQVDATQGITDAATAQSTVDAHVGAGGVAEHPAATRTAAGFASPADRALLADDLSDAQATRRSFGMQAREDFDQPGTELIWQLTPGRWRAGVSTAGFDQPFFFAEEDGNFANGGTCVLYNVIGAPTSGSNGANWPAAEDIDGYLVSQHWDEGITIPGGKLYGGAVLEIDLWGREDIGDARTMYLVLDPDSDVLHRIVGNNGVALTYRDVVLGAVHGESIGTPAALEHDGGGNLVLRYTDWATASTNTPLGTDSLIRLTNGSTSDIAESGLPPDLDGEINQPLYVVGELPLTGMAAFSGTRDVSHPSFAAMGVGDTVSIDDATTSGLTTGEYAITAKVSATRVTLGSLPGVATASPADLVGQTWGDDVFWLSRIDSGTGGWPDLVLWDASSGATSTTGVTATSGTRNLTHASFANINFYPGRLVEITSAGTSGLTTGVYEVSSVNGSTITCDDLPAVASSTVSDVQVDVYDDWSYLAFVNVGISAGSHKRMVFAFENSTLTTDYERFHIKIVGVADSMGANDDPAGMTWFAYKERLQTGEAIGIGTTQVVPAAEGLHPATWPPIAIARTRPGTGYNATAAECTGAFLFRGKANYDGAGSVAYVPTWHDFGGFYTECMLDVDITPTGSQVMRSYTDSYGDATTTMLEVGGEVVAEVTEYVKERRIIRFHDLREDVKIKRGDTVTWKLYRKISGTWNTTPHSSGTFTAGPIRIGPQFTELGLRMAVSGAQDGTTVCEVWAGQAKITRRRSI